MGHTEPNCWDVVTVPSAAEEPFEAEEMSSLPEHLAFVEIEYGQDAGKACCPVVAGAAEEMQQECLPFQSEVLVQDFVG